MWWIVTWGCLIVLILIAREGNKLKKKGLPMVAVKANPDLEIFATKIEETLQAELGEAHDGIMISYYVVRAIMDIARRKGIDKELLAELKKGGIEI